MSSRTLSLPELGLIAGTRALFGAGLGLLIAGHLQPGTRRALGWTLFGVGLLSTFPLAADVIFHHHAPSGNGHKEKREGSSVAQAAGRSFS
jgi:hypothetical protein